MRPLLCCLLLGGVWFVVPPEGAGAAPAPSPARHRPEALDLLILQALSHHPALAEERAVVRQAEAEVQSAGLFPNPVLQVEGEEMPQDFSTGPGLLMTTLNQTVLTGGKRRLRVEVARTGVERAAALYEQRALEIVRGLSGAYYQVLGARRKLEVAIELADVAGRFEKVVAQRVAGGVTRPIELDRSLVLAAQARFEIRKARADVAIAGQALAQALGVAGLLATDVGGRLEHEGGLPPLDGLIKQARERAPALRVPEREEDAAARELALAGAMRYPDIGLGLSAQHRSAVDASHDLRGFQVVIPLPILDHGQANRARARASVEGARARQKRVWVALHGRLVAAYWTAQRAHEQVEAYLTEVLPAARSALELARIGYQAGKFGYLDVLDAQRSLTTATQVYIDGLIEYHQARAELEEIVAGPVAQVPERRVQEVP